MGIGLSFVDEAGQYHHHDFLVNKGGSNLCSNADLAKLHANAICQQVVVAIHHRYISQPFNFLSYLSLVHLRLGIDAHLEIMFLLTCLLAAIE